VLRMLKRHHPGAEIYWWIENSSAALLEDDPDLAGIFQWDRKRWGTPAHYGDIWTCVQTLRSHKFDIVIDLQALARSGAIGWLANGAFTIGLEDWRELAAGFYDVNVRRPSQETHAVDWYLETLKPLGVPIRWDFEWIPENRAVAQEVTNLLGEDSANRVVLQPGARWLNKRWPVEHFAETVKTMARAGADCKFVIVGGKSDAELGQHIAAAAPEHCVNLTGRTNLPQVVEVIRASRLMITNDTGPMHIAAALRKPVVGLFGPTNPARTGPYGQQEHGIQRRDLPCIPCLSDRCRWPEPVACLRGISPGAVAEAASRILALPA
jgi:heptosyltransferase-1